MAATQEDDEDETNPFTTLLTIENPQHQPNGSAASAKAPTEDHLLQKHALRSIQSTVVIRQLPSEGLSFQLWPAATALVSLLDLHRSHPSTSPLSAVLSGDHGGCENRRQLRILELGSGTGMVGIVAAATLGGNVTITDLPNVIPNLRFNAEANAETVGCNGGAVTVTALRWGHADDVAAIGRDFDVVMASDVVYHDHLYEPLLETLRFVLLGFGEEGGERMNRKKTVFVMAHMRRWKKESAFFKKAKRLFNVDVLHACDPLEGARVGVVVYRFVPRK